MKKVRLVVQGFALSGIALMMAGCFGLNREKIISPIILSNTEYHVGDNEGAVALALTTDFVISDVFISFL